MVLNKMQALSAPQILIEIDNEPATKTHANLKDKSAKPKSVNKLSLLEDSCSVSVNQTIVAQQQPKILKPKVKEEINSTT
jgi:hypothetical protein